MSEIAEALKLARIEIKKYDEKLLKPIRTNKGNFAVETFTDFLRDELGRDFNKFPGLKDALFDDALMGPIVKDHCKEAGVWAGERVIEVPEEYSNYVLNMDLSSQDTSFFVTKDDIIVQSVTGNSYIKIMGMNETDAVAAARKVVPEYQPRGKRGVAAKIRKDKTMQDVLNTYIPPTWRGQKEWKELPDELPELFEKLLEHLIPLEIEREYFFSWLHASLFKRAYVYLILCGAPGAGKNTLKKVMSALHGRSNTADGKNSTLSERFNGPLEECTLHWFDELSYTMDLEPRMKELQNDTISIEKKGIDSTRSTDIFASFVISNNEPRNNYIAYDARKFAPLVIAGTDLKKSMTSEEIEKLANTVDERHSDFDVLFVAQIAKWVKRHGHSTKWRHLEYRGPKFWSLAQSSMFQWQKFSVHAILTSAPGGRAVHDPVKGFLFSSVHATMKKNRGRPIEVPDYERVRPFLEIYRNLKGEKVFKTIPCGGELGDFWVKTIREDMSVEKTKVRQPGLQRDQDVKKKKKEFIDL